MGPGINFPFYLQILVTDTNWITELPYLFFFNQLKCNMYENTVVRTTTSEKQDRRSPSFLSVLTKLGLILAMDNFSWKLRGKVSSQYDRKNDPKQIWKKVI